MKPPFPIGTIDRFFPKTPYFFLSNFYPCLIRLEDMLFIDVEHAYQAAKTTDMDVRRLIMAEPTAARAKKRGGAIKLRDNWDQIKHDIMYELLLQKFHPDNLNGVNLRATGQALLIEGNYWHDLIWGQCFCSRHNWDGSNKLGEMLMKIRAT
jgi:ribA/ribD-fused uncharacterized protein